MTDQIIKEMRERYKKVSLEQLAKEYGIDVNEAGRLIETMIKEEIDQSNSKCFQCEWYMNNICVNPASSYYNAEIPCNLLHTYCTKLDKKQTVADHPQSSPG